MNDKVIKTFIGKSDHLPTRMRSTSGGVFFILARYVIESKNGVVFGAGFNEKFEVRHTYVDKTEELFKLQGSKYPQSRISGVYAKIKEFLQQGRFVLFSGLPCQIVALRKYLGSDYENLLCVDLICYGVASPGLWKDYLDVFWANKKIKRIVFKDKHKSGWKKWNTLIETQDARYFLHDETNVYMSGYLKGAFMRPSCEYCRCKGTNRDSDITLGDAWGKGETHRLNDNCGLSVILINSEKGSAYFDAIRKELAYEEVDFEDYMKGNPYYFETHKFNEKLLNEFLETKDKNELRAFKNITISSFKSFVKYIIYFIKGTEKID
ncbi:MAG: Coenzyme F420 hydrogenase/dehydrogenase, beta subunit C-terminal domain [Oscillospiraceae bacterium]|nr:Coenzyme F420 hydrogenase/dehydrogenase, beta subunit C-terminal domain [Oscillospiraceae bacterium]